MGRSIFNVLVFVIAVYAISESYATTKNDIIINELAWMGTTVSSSDEWIELRNTTDTVINLAGWTLKATDGTPSINLTGSVPAGGLFLLERTNDSSVPGIPANLIYTGGMKNSGEVLELRDPSGLLIDKVNGWSAGSNSLKATMARTQTGWKTATVKYNVGMGSPKSANTGSQSETGKVQHINQVNK